MFNVSVRACLARIAWQWTPKCTSVVRGHQCPLGSLSEMTAVYAFAWMRAASEEFLPFKPASENKIRKKLYSKKGHKQTRGCARGKGPQLYTSRTRTQIGPWKAGLEPKEKAISLAMYTSSERTWTMIQDDPSRIRVQPKWNFILLQFTSFHFIHDWDVWPLEVLPFVRRSHRPHPCRCNLMCMWLCNCDALPPSPRQRLFYSFVALTSLIFDNDKSTCCTVKNRVVLSKILE